MNKTPELLPCPFCGEEAELVRHECGFDVECTGCAIISPADSLEASIKFWNARVYPPEVRAAIERATPKKPKGYTVRGVFGCPTCGNMIYFIGGDTRKKPVCAECGQRLDWSEK